MEFNNHVNMKAIEKNGKTIIGVPKEWQRPSSPPNMVTLAYNEYPDEVHYEDGFLNITSPTYNTETEELLTDQVDKIFDGLTLIGYQWKKRYFSPEEIENNAQKALDNDESAIKVSNREPDGKIYYKRKMDAIERALSEGKLGIAAIRLANRYFDVSLSPLTRGNWASAQSALLTAPTIAQFTNLERQRLTAFYNEVVTDVNNYVTQTYQ